jgi:hypothetical protein
MMIFMSLADGIVTLLSLQEYQQQVELFDHHRFIVIYII